MLANMRQMLKDAEDGGYCIGCINTPNLETVRGVIAAAEEVNVPIIIDHAQVHDENGIKVEVIGPLMVEYAKKAGMISQAALSITYSPVHTVEYYMGVVDHLVEYGADEICLKDMAGIGRPTFLAQLTSEIKKKYPHIKVQYHGHCGPGFSPASMLEVARARADYIDVAVEPLSWGKVHPDVITVREMLKADGFLVKDINMDAYMQVRALTQEFIDDFLGYWINPANKVMTSLLVGCGLPGGMMGSMMADLKPFLGAVNAAERAAGRPDITLDTLMVKLFEEVQYVWPRLGYPPLVTPFSQYVKNTALMNLLNVVKGNPRWTTIDKDNDEGRGLGRRARPGGTLRVRHARKAVPRLPFRPCQAALQCRT